MQLIPAMRLLVVCVLIAGCDGSARERIDRLEEEVDIVCWEYKNCGNYPGGPPSVSIERAVSCMNDALASGARAVASWSHDDFETGIDTHKMVFTVDHQVKAFYRLSDGYNEAHMVEGPACAGPFRISDQPFTCSVELAWDGCP